MWWLQNLHFESDMRESTPSDMTSSSVQGGIPETATSLQSNARLGPSSPASGLPFPPAVPKQEPMDNEERNDSGINSGSDFHTSSPESDRIEKSPSGDQATGPNPQTDYYSTPLARTDTRATRKYQKQQILKELGALIASYSNKQDQQKMEIEQDSSHSEAAKRPENMNSFRSLQMILERNCTVSSPEVSPKISECSDESKLESDMENDNDLTKPKKNSHGKVTTIKCKQCDFVAINKLESWQHNRIHIKPNKLLTCPRCPFVTEYKHHLRYHLRNHLKSKPFKCSHCPYRCVNKSMLNSHLKSHSSVYQYRCANCAYVTKYCHSLKLHLRKYSHEPDTVLNPDGTPNPLPIIDVYGTRRGPKLKVQDSKPSEEPNQEPILPFNMNQFFNAQLPVVFPNMGYFPTMPNPLFLRSLENLVNAQAALLSSPEQQQEEPSTSILDPEVLDLSKPDETTQRHRRKGLAVKLTPTQSVSSDNEEETTMFSNVEVVEDIPEVKEAVEETRPEESTVNNNDNQERFSCQYCVINFGDPVLHTMHMGYHGYNNPFTCNMCGEECHNKVGFFVHIARSSHS